jgi:two-component system chemotaxis response regulator CheB
MPIPFDAVVVGASLDGLRGMTMLLSTLPPDFPCPIVFVQHLASRSPSALARILERKTRRPVRFAVDGQPLVPGWTHVAPPDCHLAIEVDRTFSLRSGPRVNHSCPAIDVLFKSAAQTFRERLIAVILTGASHDGAAGVRAVKASGGRVLVQNETRLPFARMPLAAQETRCVDFVLPVPSIAQALVSFVMVPGAAAIFSTPPRLH